MQQRAAGGDASVVMAKVAASGFADVAGLPDTVQGFGQALVKLRDLNATNVVLAIHASMWSSGMDIASDTRSSINAAGEADKTAAFLNSAGSWDVVFNDVDDHDAGWWEAQGADNQFFTHWWNPSNTTFPNFTRYLAWVAELRAKTARPQVVWQVPVGNQYFLTMINTCGHYQDNVAPYFISHASDLFNAGLVAVLFGAGNGCQTGYADGARDGVTNNGGKTCAKSMCHSSNRPQRDLVLEKDSAYANIVSVPSEEASDNLVEPGDSGASYLYRKVNGGPNITGHRMPDSGGSLSSADIELIRQWIDAGAPNN